MGIATRCRALANWGHMLLFHTVETTPAQLPALPQAGGRGAHHPHASCGVPISPLPSMGGLSSRDPWDGTAAPCCCASEESQEQIPSPDMCQGPARHQHPPSAPHTGEVSGLEEPHGYS